MYLSSLLSSFSCLLVWRNIEFQVTEILHQCLSKYFISLYTSQLCVITMIENCCSRVLNIPIYTYFPWNRIQLIITIRKTYKSTMDANRNISLASLWIILQAYSISLCFTWLPLQILCFLTKLRLAALHGASQWTHFPTLAHFVSLYNILVLLANISDFFHYYYICCSGVWSVTFVVTIVIVWATTNCTHIRWWT